MIWTVSADGRDLTVALKQSDDELKALHGTWRDILAASSSDSAFLTWEWVYSWSEHFLNHNRRLFVFVVADGPQVIAIAPWYIEQTTVGLVTRREIRFLGSPEAGSDYLDVIVRRRKEGIVAEALLTVLLERVGSSWDLLALKDIPSDSAFFAQFIAHLRQCRQPYVIEEGSFCPIVQLPPTFDAYLGQLSSHARQAYRRKMRRFMSNPQVEHVVLRGEELQAGLAAFRALYEKRWGAPMDGLYNLVTSYTARAAADRSNAWRTELSLLKVDGQAVAALVHLTSGRRTCQYLMAVDRTFNRKLSIGTLICGMNIQAAIEAGLSDYDFLKGEEGHKLQLMNTGRRAMNITVHNRTFGAVSAWSIQTAKGLRRLLIP